jgi:hypothetical protein
LTDEAFYQQIVTGAIGAALFTGIGAIPAFLTTSNPTVLGITASLIAAALGIVVALIIAGNLVRSRAKRIRETKERLEPLLIGKFEPDSEEGKQISDASKLLAGLTEHSNAYYIRGLVFTVAGGIATIILTLQTLGLFK